MPLIGLLRLQHLFRGLIPFSFLFVFNHLHQRFLLRKFGFGVAVFLVFCYLVTYGVVFALGASWVHVAAHLPRVARISQTRKVHQMAMIHIWVSFVLVQARKVLTRLAGSNLFTAPDPGPSMAISPLPLAHEVGVRRLRLHGKL